MEEPALVGAIQASIVALRFIDLGDAGEQQLRQALVELGADLDAAGVPQAYRSAR